MCSNGSSSSSGSGSGRKDNNLQHHQQQQPSGLSSFSLPSSSPQQQHQQLSHFSLVGQQHQQHQQQQYFVPQQYQPSQQVIAANNTAAAVYIPNNSNNNNNFLHDYNYPSIGHLSPLDRLLDAAALSGNTQQQDQHKTTDSTIPAVYTCPPVRRAAETSVNFNNLDVGGFGAAADHATYPPQFTTLNNNFNSMKHQSSAMSKAGKPHQHRQRSRRKSDTRSVAIDQSTKKKAGTTTTSNAPAEVRTTTKNSADLTVNLIKAGDIRSHDVLCGRDKATFNFIGNKRFRSSIGTFIPVYAAAKTKREKANVIVSAVRKIRIEDGSRFLKKYEASPDDGVDSPNEDLYMELDEVQARKKTGHALRDLFVARSQKQARRAASASVSASKATTGDNSQEPSKSIETQPGSRSSSESTLDKDDNEDDISGYGLDDDRRQSDISVVQGRASNNDDDMIEDNAETDLEKKQQRRPRQKLQQQQQQQGPIENSFSEESFSDSLSSMLPFVEEDTTRHDEIDGIEPLPAFSRPSSHHDLLQESLQPINNTTDQQSMAVQVPPLFPHPVFPGPVGIAQGAPPHPYPVYVPFPPTPTHVHAQHPSLYSSAFPFPPPAMHASPMHPHQQHPQQLQLNQPQPQEAPQPEQPQEAPQPEQPQTEQTEQQLQQYHMYHHHFYHHFPHDSSGSGGT